MNITLRQLTYFKALAEQRNFGRAAEVVHVSQPALSVQIRELEKTLGAVLVERQARDVVLTPFGRRILAHAERVLAATQALGDAARWRGGLSGQLRLGLIPTIAPYLLPTALEALRSRDISLDVQVQEAKTGRLLAELRAGRLDAAVIALPSAEEGLIEIPLFEDRFLLAGSAARLAAQGGGPGADALRPMELGASQLLLLEEGHCLTDQALDVCGRGRGHAQINMGASSLSTLSRLVAAGFGLTLMPELAALQEQRAAPDMHLMRFSAPEPARQVGLVRREASEDDGWFTALATMLSDVGTTLVAEARRGCP
ncbi:MAG: LysR substrate-binding domain-containing protein [Paracoccaceae bacterium]|jgi:LysR family hydrogen peroxide-inducible transcriptional activator|uniref:LysR substrate-binding domain-containing protein n=1 Tax=unclassified Seohaeicola TaxID=2641111 RepID=UPI00237AD59A|nr:MULTISPECIES: LysR substrate-binding domain-containing protein [unclassified Seohaeicola]MDD9707285.1 LysR substrate-binding domain-containing protein [Seohaeicola sp. 4SK31]MDD9735526.1 LysR substrate-binding domain-containing protein [Seohaeicola sp. SP36]MDF1710281.1 LysR substrate-binding domain-containing protein [Paracoccaceae bacterium]MDM7970676.1 LysR substrate-binding domain-containing protein [Paracoccaceae bacterium]